jgi:hypothetical protein
MTDTTIKNSTHNSKNGRYALGGVTETSSFAIEWWDRNYLDKDVTDIIYSIEKKYEGRPDLLGFLFYGDPALWWVVAQYNGIVDPIGELIEGKVLFVPLIERVRGSMMVNKIGGIPSTRNG